MQFCCLPLTLCPHHYQRDLGSVAMHGQLAVALVHLLETGLVLQAENQDGRVQPGAELERVEGSGEKGGGRYKREDGGRRGR